MLENPYVLAALMTAGLIGSVIILVSWIGFAKYIGGNGPLTLLLVSLPPVVCIYTFLVWVFSQ